MNQNKICFISCVNNDRMYKECLTYLNNLNFPEKYEFEFLSIRNASSISAGYNEAMKSSDAKYKIYLHQDVLIIDKDFITTILDVFNSDSKIGLLGLIGAKKLAEDCVWWNSQEKVGSVYDTHRGFLEPISFQKSDQYLNDVQVVDGILMATQYDVSFRSDLFNGWHYYDVSQSMEFRRKGYRVVVPAFEKPCCIHECGITQTGYRFEFYRKLFFNEYFNELEV